MGNAAFPRKLKRHEAELIAARRRQAGVEKAEPLIGLALSGGGIRSATFALGLLQALAKANLLRRIDYLSTVSGGSYCGAFLGALYCRSSDDAVESVQESLAHGSSPPVSWLRENGRYLAPNGGSDVLVAVAQTVRNWGAVHVTMGIWFLASFILLQQVKTYLPALLQSNLRLGGHFVDPIWLLPVAVLGVVVLPLVACYWLIGPSRPCRAEALQRSSLLPAWLPMIVYVVVLCCCYGIIKNYWPGQSSIAAPPGADNLPLFILAVVVALMTALSLVAYWVVALNTLRQADHQSAVGHALDRRAMLRNLATDWLGRWAGFMLAMAGLALVDSCGGWLYSKIKDHTLLASITALSSLTIPPLAQKLAKLIGGRSQMREFVEHYWNLVWAVLALSLGLALLVAWNAFAHALFFWIAPYGASAVWSAIICLVILVALAGNTLSFINRSSLQTFYAARLTRAYLGASNRQRRKPENADVTDVIAGDAMAMSKYKPHRRGGPLHLINVTVNETCDGRSSIEQRDRKGIPLAIGPSGVSAGVKHHALWRSGGLKSIAPRRGFQIFPKQPQGANPPIAPETLDLGNWTAVSGAAASTGSGMHTSLGLSLLCGLANIRLGYWWDSGIKPGDRAGDVSPRDHAGGRPGRATPSYGERLGEIFNQALPVYATLADEWTARFHGPARKYWNLSDGGHFENLGAYELLRRRLPLIIVSDAECDPEYKFEDLARLVRLARTDFGASIEFVTKDSAQKTPDPIAKLIGGLAAIRPQEAAPGELKYSHQVAAVARIDYRRAESEGGITPAEPESLDKSPLGHADTGWLVLIKAAVTGKEPVDVLDYHRQNPDFPQQTTAEQFFDEAQWESYRYLGQFIGQTLAPSLDDLIKSSR